MNIKHVITYLLVNMCCLHHICFASPLPSRVPISLQEWKKIEGALKKGKFSINTHHNLSIVKDKTNNHIYIHLKGRKGAYIGKGAEKYISKSILYGDKPRVVARCEGGIGVLEEGKVLSLFKGAQGIVQIHSAIQTSPKTSELILEYYNYGTLKGLETGKVTIPDESIPAIAHDLLMGLKAIHDKGYIHRDLHRRNILLKKHKNKIRAAIVDLGRAIPIDHRPHAWAGVSNSTCPAEALTTSRSNIDRKKSECYSMGVLFHVLVFRQLPTWTRVIHQSHISRQTEKSKQEQLQRIQTLYKETVAKYTRPEVNTKKQKIADLTLKMLNPNPEERISVEAALQEVLALL